MSISCFSERYLWINIYAGAMVLVYPIGVPTLLFLMLRRWRYQLNPRLKNPIMSDEDVERIRYGTTNTETITQFAVLYKPRWMYYEVFNTFRRLTLTSFVLACPTLAITTIFTVCVSILTLVIERESQPHQVGFGFQRNSTFSPHRRHAAHRATRSATTY
jgi:hypothetical protein